MFTAILFEIPPNRKPPQCQWMREWVNKFVIHPYNRILPSKKKEKVMDICNNTDEYENNYIEWKKARHKTEYITLFI